ncbi:hypothetical protein [Streptomyces sp. NPDC049040]|uniref:hypothetical protein n=1 Tax=Streptomyces sp. NPDC049040 TaxID=3365593 RepID=UPI003719EF41
MRSVEPEDLEQSATLLDGADPASLKNGTDSAFSRAATLGVTSKPAGLRPMAAWVTETAPDLRRRAAAYGRRVLRHRRDPDRPDRQLHHVRPPHSWGRA